MSVAFRRESDEEHREPRFELPIPPGPNLVTARGLALIEGKVAELEATLRDAGDGDTREAIARDLRYWRTRRATAVVTAPAPGPAVGFGRSVRIRLGGRERVLTIVGHDEADPGGARVALTAPLARALIGAEAGDLVDFAGKGEAIEVLAVDPV